MSNTTENEILRAAKKIFVQKGFAGARMQEIADEADINKSMLHYYFRNKESLFDRIVKDSLDLVIPKLTDSIGGNGIVMQKIERLVDTYIDTILGHPHIPLFILNELSQQRIGFVDKMKEKLDEHRAFSQFMLQIENEQGQGILKPVAPQHLFLTVMSLVAFPFLSKPIFSNIFNVPESEFNTMMLERKAIVMEFLRSALMK